MLISIKRWTRGCLLGVLPLIGTLLLAPQKAEAQWAVFDAGNLTNAVKIWKEDISMNQKMALELVQGVKLFNQTLQIYNLAKQETAFLQKGQVLQAVGFAAMHASIPGHPEWDKNLMLAGGIAAAASSWQRMTNPSLSLQNRILLADSFAASALQSLGNCNAAAMGNKASLGALEQVVMDMGSGANSAANQRNIANMSAAQKARYDQCEENLAEQRLKLEVLRAHEMRTRDQAAVDLSQALTTYNQAGAGQWDISPDADLRRTGMH